MEQDDVMLVPTIKISAAACRFSALAADFLQLPAQFSVLAADILH